MFSLSLCVIELEHICDVCAVHQQFSVLIRAAKTIVLSQQSNTQSRIITTHTDPHGGHNIFKHAARTAPRMLRIVITDGSCSDAGFRLRTDNCHRR